MNSDEFRAYGRQMVDYIADYLEKIRDRPVVHNVKPGYMKDMLPAEAPDTPEEFSKVFEDIEKVIMPGVTHWHSPYFHGFVPAGTSYPAILGDMLSDAIGCIGFTWDASPACTELEMITTDWLGKMIGLPEDYLHCGPGPGGGVIQSTASETVFLCLLAARTKTINKYKTTHPEMDEATILSKLVCYSSDQGNSSVHRSGLLGAVTMVRLPTNNDFNLTGETLRQAINKDVANGMIPFFLCATLGTTGTCAFDRLQELGPICDENDMWLHVDAAYAGNAFICPEFRHYMKGIEFAQSLSINPHKWLLVSFDLSVMWIKDRSHLVDAFSVTPLYLKHDYEGQTPDFRHWSIPQSRRFRSLKLWFTIRSYGVQGIQKHIRNHCQLARELEELILKDERFEIVAKAVMGLVCFRIKGNNILSRKLFENITAGGRIYLNSAIHKDVYFLRLAVCAERTTSEDIRSSFNIIETYTDKLMQMNLIVNGHVA